MGGAWWVLVSWCGWRARHSLASKCCALFVPGAWAPELVEGQAVLSGGGRE